MAIKALETYYNGYRFRSRTEARWAVYFNSLGIPFEYEPEGFRLPNGENYLPDFRLSLRTRELRYYWWAEVKGQPFTPAERLRCDLLSQLVSCPVILLVGSPDAISYEYCRHPYTEEELQNCTPGEREMLTENRWDDLILGSDYALTEGRFYTCTGFGPGSSLGWHSIAITNALNASRSERFGT